MENYLDQSIQSLRRFEGSIPWMYLDTVGKVTVGVGLMLANETAATAIPFSIAGRRATPDEITKDFLRITGMKSGQAARIYRTASGVYLTDDVIDDLLRSTLLGSEGYLRTHIPRYDTLPEAAKLALLDMIYNLGPGRLFAEYPRLLAAIERGDWKTAAAASLRRGPSPTRNAWTRQQFLDAAAGVVHAIEAEVAHSSWTALLVGSLAAVTGVAALAILLGEFNRSPRPQTSPSEQ